MSQANLNFVEMRLTAERHTIATGDVCIDHRMQMRTAMTNRAVEEYADNIEALLKEKPIEVAEIDGKWYVVNGFHRWHAAKLAELETIEVTLYKTTWDEARRYAMASNWDNGVRPSKEDADKAIQILLETAPDFGFDSKSVTKYLTSFGIPRSTANKHTVSLRGDIDAKRDAEIVRLDAEGVSQTKIASAVSSSRGTVQNILTDCQNCSASENGTQESDCPFPIDEDDIIPAHNPADGKVTKVTAEIAADLAEEEIERQQIAKDTTVVPEVVRSDNETEETSYAHYKGVLNLLNECHKRHGNKGVTTFLEEVGTEDEDLIENLLSIAELIKADRA